MTDRLIILAAGVNDHNGEYSYREDHRFTPRPDVRIIGDSTMTSEGHEITRYGPDGEVVFRSLNGRKIFPVTTAGPKPNRHERRRGQKMVRRKP